jgi:tRNA1Val (adenine37-N6)-methyltransferase
MKRRGDFHFKRFSIAHDQSTHKVGTDGVLLGAWANVEGATKILDIGTGTGLVAIMLAQRSSSAATIDAVELQEADAQQAKLNVEKSPWPDKIAVTHSPVQQFNPGHRYDLIVSNPPFFINSWLPPDDQRSTARHTQHLSFPELLSNADRLLTSAGRFVVVLPFIEGNEFINMALPMGLYVSRKLEFKSRKDKPVERLLVEFSRQQAHVNCEQLVLYDHGEVWSEGYRRLTRDFYLKS